LLQTLLRFKNRMAPYPSNIEKSEPYPSISHL
jgi:hypothetical protein